MKDLKERKTSDNKAKATTGREIHKRKQTNWKRETWNKKRKWKNRRIIYTGCDFQDTKMGPLLRFRTLWRHTLITLIKINRKSKGSIHVG